MTDRKTLEHYSDLAAAAQAPMLRQLLTEARALLSDIDPLARRIDIAMGRTQLCPLHTDGIHGTTDCLPAEQSEEKDLVWENYGAGWGWFRADLTNGRQRA
jgi:hypothetical protein